MPFLLIDFFMLRQGIFFSNNHCECIPVFPHFYNSIYDISWSLELCFILYSYVNKSFPSSNIFLNNLFFLKYLKAHFCHLFNYFMCNSWVCLGTFCLVKTKTVSSKPHVKMRNGTWSWFMSFPTEPPPFQSFEVSNYNLYFRYLIFLVEYQPDKHQEETGSWHSPVPGRGGELYPGIQKCRGEGQESHHRCELHSFFSEMPLGEKRGASNLGMTHRFHLLKT